MSRIRGGVRPSAACLRSPRRGPVYVNACLIAGWDGGEDRNPRSDQNGPEEGME